MQVSNNGHGGGGKNYKTKDIIKTSNKK